MDGADRIAGLVKRWREGDPFAVELFAGYARRLSRLAEQHLSGRLRVRVDGEDVVQSVFRTFFRRCLAGEFRIDSSEQLWALLVTITLRKTWAKRRQHTAASRNAGAEVSDGEAWLRVAVARDPSPEEGAALVDEIEAVLEGLPEAYGRILALRLEGHSATEVAAELGVSRQTVHRILMLFQERLDRQNTDGL